MIIYEFSLLGPGIKADFVWENAVAAEYLYGLSTSGVVPTPLQTISSDQSQQQQQGHAW
jgi:hypothetical protein